MTTADTQAAIDQIIAQLASTLKTDELIERARNVLDIPPGADAHDDDGVTLKISDHVQSAMINELLAQAAEAKRVVDAAQADYDAVKDLLTELLGEQRTDLKVHNQLVFTARYSESRVLDQAYLKSKFPDIPGNEEFWTTQRRRNRLFK